MITLPKGWEDGIQVRDMMAPVNQFGELGLLLLILRNKDNQVWSYENTIWIPDFDKDNVDVKDLLDQCYRRMLYAAPGVAVNMEQVINYKNGTERYEDITNDEWEILVDPYLTPYKDFNYKEKIHAELVDRSF